VDTTRPDAGRVDTRRPDRRTPDDEPGDRTPDGLHTRRLDSRTPDDGTGWVDTACWTWTGDRRHGWRRIVENGDGACPLDAPLGRRVWASKPGQLSSKDYEGDHALRTGLDHRHDRQLLGGPLRRTGRASAHCCPRKMVWVRVARDGGWHPLW
jgi:hypothetical protein